MKNYKLFIVYCLFLNFSNCHSDMKKSWLSTKSSKNQLAPNLEPDLPKFTPFDNDENDDAINNDNNNNNNNSNKLFEERKEEGNMKENKVPFQLNKDDETFIDKLLPFSEYIHDIYDNFKNTKSKKHKKIHKKKHHAEKIQDQDHDDDIDNEFTTETITTVKREDNESATTTENFNQNENTFVDNIAAMDNAISVEEEEQATESSDMISKQVKKNNKFLRYNVGPGVNVSLDVSNEVVRVQLDENCLKDVFSGRGKKKELITKTLALFILPFLIQTSFVPFLLSTIKLMLVNSVVVGKIAILLFLIALFKNYKLNNSHDTMPYYLDTAQSNYHHHRRSEFDNKGYLAVGKPETYIT